MFCGVCFSCGLLDWIVGWFVLVVDGWWFALCCVWFGCCYRFVICLFCLCLWVCLVRCCWFACLLIDCWLLLCCFGLFCWFWLILLWCLLVCLIYLFVLRCFVHWCICLVLVLLDLFVALFVLAFDLWVSLDYSCFVCVWCDLFVMGLC